MGLSNYIDLTEKINAEGSVVLDVGDYISGVIYCWDIAANSSILFFTSNNGGEEEGTIIGSPLTADNFTPCIVTDITSGLPFVDTGSSSAGSYKFEKICKYLKIEIGGLIPGPVGKLLIQLYKIK